MSDAGTHSYFISKILTRNSFDSLLVSCDKIPCPSWLIPNERNPANNTTISDAVRSKSCALSKSISSGLTLKSSFRKFLKPSAKGSKTSKDSLSVLSSVASPRPGKNETSFPDAFSIPTQPPKTIMSAIEAPVEVDISSYLLIIVLS